MTTTPTMTPAQKKAAFTSFLNNETQRVAEHRGADVMAVYAAFLAYLERHKLPPVSRPSFEKSMRLRGYSYDYGRNRFYIGLVIKPMMPSYTVT
jgi:hypothetical protein